jgi:hypothetical protein
MNGARFRLLLTAVLFVGWIGYLAYLAFTSGTRPVTQEHPIVLSRAQLLVSTLDVIAELHADQDRPATTVTIKAVHWSRQEPPPVSPGATISVPNLAHSSGWKGPGEYILPLVKTAGGEYEVASTPLSPGYKPSGEAPARIYPSTLQTLSQLKMIPKPDRT